MARQQFPFYKSFDDVAEDLTDIQLAKYIRTLLDVQFLRIRINDVVFEDKTLNIVWKSQKHSINKSIQGFLDGQKRETVKNPYFGAYDDNFVVPAEGVRDGKKTPTLQGKEQGKEQGKGKGEVQVSNCLKKQSLSEKISLKLKETGGVINIDAFEEWMSYKKYKSITPISKVINFLSKYNFNTQKEIVDVSIMNGWKGLFEPKQVKYQQMSFKQQDSKKTDDAIDAFLDARDNGFDLRNVNKRVQDVEVIEV